MKRAFTLHLSHDAVVNFLGGTPDAVPDHYREADPMELKLEHAQQWLLHGLEDDTVPPEFSRNYAAEKRKRGERVELSEVGRAGHFELIDPSSAAFAQVSLVVKAALA